MKTHQNKKNEIEAIWKCCFPNETDGFIRLWFDRVYKDEQTLIINENGRIISSLQIIPYEMNYFGERISVAYVCGVSTLPEARGKGWMTQLMQKALKFMNDRGFAITALIPSSETLFTYYQRFGYQTVFYYSVETHYFRDNAQLSTQYQVTTSDRITETVVYPYYNRKQIEQPCAVTHTVYDLETIRLDCSVDNGNCWIAHIGEHPAGIAFAVPRANETVFFKEIRSDNNAVKDILIQTILGYYNARCAHVRTPSVPESSVPYGMVRILDEKRMRDIYHLHMQLVGSKMYTDVEINTQTLLNHIRQAGHMNLMLD